MEDIEQKLLECKVFIRDNINIKEIGYYIYKNYIVSVYRLEKIAEDGDDIGSFENVYAVYDMEKDTVFDEYAVEYSHIFDELPGIDGVLFNYDFKNRDIVESSKKIIKECVKKYYETKIIDERYKKSLENIYENIDESSKNFFKFFKD